MLTLETLKHIQDHNDFHHNRALSDMQIRNGTTRDKISAFFSHSCPWEIVNGERTSGLNIGGERERERYTVQKRVRKHINTAKNESKFLDQGKERERRNVKLFVSSSFSLWKKKFISWWKKYATIIPAFRIIPRVNFAFIHKKNFCVGWETCN